MIRKGILLLTAVFILGVILESCCKNGEKYYKRITLNFEHTSKSDSALSNSESVWHLDSLVIDTNSSYYFRFYFDLVYYGANQVKFFNPCYATQCHERGYEGASSPIDDFKFTSDKDYNEDYPAGTNLRPLLVDFENVRPNVEYINNRSRYSGVFIELKFKERPILDSVHTFTLTLREASKVKFVETTSPVTFK